MLIPIGTNVEHRRYPMVTYWLIGINILLFAAQWAIGRAGGIDSSNEIVQYLALLEFDGQLSRSSFHYLSLISYQFLHADWWHIIFNMIFLLPFGKVVEDRFGHIGFLLFYLGCGAFGGYVHTLLHINPVIGASGSVCAVVAAFVVLAPKTKTHVLLVFFIIGVYSIPSMLLVAFFIGIDVFSQLASLLGQNSSNTAWVVHLCGYASGFSIAFIALHFGWVTSSEYDLPYAFKQWRRRRHFTSVTSSTVNKIKTVYTPNELLRVTIAEKAMQENIEEAQAEYDQAIAKDSSFIVDARTLHTLATNLIKQGELAQGILLFEQYLDHYKQAKDRGEVALLLAAKYIRALGDKKRGKKLLKEYSASFSPEHTQLASTLTEEANT